MTIPASWNQRHRLGQTAEDLSMGVFNPHHCNKSFELSGPIELDAINRAWRALQERHPVLRSGFDARELTWHVGLAEPADIERITPAGQAEGLPTYPEPSAAIETLRRACARPFDLQHGPVARLAVLRSHERLTYLALVVEHLVSDGWSMNILLRDLIGLYAREIGIQVADLPPVEMSFPDYVCEQDRLVQSAEGQHALASLAGRLASVGAIPVMPVRGFSDVTLVRHERTGKFQRHVPADLYARVKRAARTARMTPFSFVHAALHEGLSLCSDRDQSATTLSLANREDRQVRECVGWFASKAIVVTTPRAHRDVKEFLAHFREQVFAALDSALIPWPALIAWMNPSRLGRQAQVPYVTFNATSAVMQDTTDVGWELTGLLARSLPISVGWHDASIATFWEESPESLKANIVFKADWYASSDAETLIDQTLSVLEAWCRPGAVGC